MSRGPTPHAMVPKELAALVTPVTAAGVFWFLAPARCGVPKCNRYAVEIDCFAPYHQEQNRCRAHAMTPPGSDR